MSKFDKTYKALITESSDIDVNQILDPYFEEEISPKDFKGNGGVNIAQGLDKLFLRYLDNKIEQLESDINNGDIDNEEDGQMFKDLYDKMQKIKITAKY